MGTLPRPTKIIGVGRNYVAHAEELGHAVPDTPLVFLMPPSAVIGSGDAIELPSDSRHVEHEAEIGIVIGRRARTVSEADAMQFVAGVVCVNDVTARDLQRTDSQWFRAKGFDTFCAIGPMAPVDDLPPLEQLEVRCRVNGVERQHGRARDMKFSVPFLIAYISRIMTLEPGDVITTGTPSGVGPLVPGDAVEVEIPGVGTLVNRCVARPDHANGAT